MSRVKLAIFGAIIIALGIIISVSVFTVRETEQALVLQFGQWKRTASDPGIQFKWAWQSAQKFEKRVLSVDPPAEEVLLSDQKRILVDAFARYKIKDPLKFFQTVRTESTFQNRFGNILTSCLLYTSPSPRDGLLSRMPSSA